jgi:hypothetical protein
MYNSGDSGEPCGTPAGVVRGYVVVLLNASLVVRFSRKLLVHSVVALGICLFCRLWISCWWCTLLKDPATSINIAVYTSLVFHALWMFSDRIIIASSALLPGRPPYSLPIYRPRSFASQAHWRFSPQISGEKYQ